MVELYQAWKRDLLWKKLELEGEAEVLQEDVADQDQESIHCPEFLEEVRPPATTATRKAILPENAMNLLKVEERGHLQKVQMAGALSVMRRVIKRSTVQIEEEIATEGEVEADLALTLEAFPKEDQDLDLTQEARKTTHLPAQDLDPDLGQDPDQTQRRAKAPASIPTADLLERNQRNTSQKAVIVHPVPRRDLDLVLTQETLVQEALAQDLSQRRMEKRLTPPPSLNCRSRPLRVNK